MSEAEILQVPSPADFHVHLRQGDMSALVTPHVALGGFKLAYVMPNTKPPVTTTEQALAYKQTLEAIDPRIEYMMTLYLSPELTPDEIRKAKGAGIAGVKSYPRGVTTNSDSGIESYEVYYPVFEAMQEVDMVLNLHGEIPSEARTNTCVLNAEPQFLPHLRKLHAAFPRLRIVLEHATTRAAVECVKELGDTVACSITAHHLALTVDDWAGQSWNFCKPVAKYPDDREALRDIIKEGHPRFFLGSDSAPHPPSSKSNAMPDSPCAAGVYTSPILLPLVAHLLESFGALDRLADFVSNNGRRFYKKELPVAAPVVKLRRSPETVRTQWTLGEEKVTPLAYTDVIMMSAMDILPLSSTSAWSYNSEVTNKMVSNERNSSSESEQSWNTPGLPTLVSQAPQRPGLKHLLLFTSLFIPIVFLPYVPLRRHLWQQTRQLEVLKSHLGNQLSVTKENSKKLAAAIQENQQLRQEIQTLRPELQKLYAGLEELKKGNRDKEVRDLNQAQWNQEILGAIERMQKDTRPLTPETFKQLSEALVHLAAFVEGEERRYGLNQTLEDESHGVSVMRTLAMRLLAVSGMDSTYTAEEIKKTSIARLIHTMSADKVPAMSTPELTTPAAAGSSKHEEDGKGEAETLASEEVIELQAFIERREWIEDKIRQLLEKMPPIEVFAGIQELLASSTTPITSLPTREELAKWVAEHDRIEHEAEQFDAGDMSRLKKFTKAATQRNLSREDTDLIEVTLTTLLALDRLLHLLRGRAENLELMSIRLTWEEQRLLAWNEHQSILADLRAFITNKARWSTASLEQTPQPSASASALDRRLSSASNASGPPGDLTTRSSLSRGSRYMLGETLSLDAAQLSTRLLGVNKSVVASGKTLDKLIDSSHRKPVPDEILDEQDKIENESGSMQEAGKFAMAMVMQWKKSDEIYGELKKDQSAAATLKEEIENAKLQHPSQKLNESFSARSSALTSRLALVGDPATSRSFPRPTHPLFPDQNASNMALTKLLSRELAITSKAIREAAGSAAQYQTMVQNITEVEGLRDKMVALVKQLEAITKHYTTGIPSQDGDGSIPNVEDASCLNPTRHGAFLALLPATLKEHDIADQEASRSKAQCKTHLLKVGAAGIDPDLKSGVLDAMERLEKQQEITQVARKNVHDRIETMREARAIKAAVDVVQETTIGLRRQIIRSLQHQRWKPQRVQDGRPMTPESPPPITAQPLLTPSDAYLQADELTVQTSSTVEKPLLALAPSLGPSLSSALEDMQRSLTHRIREVRRLTALWESIKRQTAAMDAVRREAHNLEADLADLLYQYDTVLDQSTDGYSEHSEIVAREASLKTLQDSTNERAQQFVGTLSTRVPFIANSAHSEAFSLSSTNDDHDAPGRLPFALISLDDSVRADANAYAVSISGSLAQLSKKSNFLKIALLAQGFETAKKPVVDELAETSQVVASIQSALDQLEGSEHEQPILNTLSSYENQINILLRDFAPRVGSKFASVRHALAKMTTAPGANDPFVQERYLNSRSREVEKLAAMIESSTRDLSALANRVMSMKLLETRRIEAEEAKALADLRAKEEAEERARLEAEIARFEEEERKRKEQEEIQRAEAEKARLDAEEAARRAEEARQLEKEAEQARLKAEREAELLEQQRLRDEERAKVEAEKQRLEAEAQAHREAEAAARRELEENRRREQETLSKIAAEREAHETEQRKRRDTETERLAEEAKLRAEVARQESEILRLEEEIRKDRETRKSMDANGADEFGPASALVVVSPEGAMEDSAVFGTNAPHALGMSEDMIQLKAKIAKIRSELRDIGINALARPSINAPFPAKTDVDKMRVRFLRLQKERSKLPDGSPDPLLNAELTSLKFEVDNSVILMAHLTRLTEFVKRLAVCDGALSELLNHVDSYPALPAMEDLVHHFSDPKDTPQAQMTARLKFTEDVIGRLKSCAESLSEDKRVVEESKRIHQTWEELHDMANDCLLEMPSRPSTSTSINSMSVSSVKRRSLVPSSSGPSPLDLSTRRGPSTPRMNPSASSSRAPSVSSSVRRPSSRISTRSVSGPMTMSTPKAPSSRPISTPGTGGLRVRERTTSTSSNVSTGIFGPSSRLLASTFSSRQRANRLGASLSTPPPMRPLSRGPSSSPPSYQAPIQGGSWSKARRPSYGGTLPRNFKSPPETPAPKPRRKYVPNPTNKLDVAVGAVVNQLPVDIGIEASEDNWKDKSGKYWIGDDDPKLCYCRILRSETVMVRVGGGWVELSKFIKDHFADLFRLLPATVTSPPQALQENGPKWISSGTLLEDSDQTPTRRPRSAMAKPGTPEPKRAPSRASPSPGIGAPTFKTPPVHAPGGGSRSSGTTNLTTESDYSSWARRSANTWAIKAIGMAVIDVL
ncbi:Growth-Arrest-Specific Protein 2 Domain [Rhizoctonia solani]|uniref:dihydroorotase n=1 Tax=Rhizoctonia solani TaxID=456999 RepID=A0A8H7LP97_9AGAM|nr:Growth-Arrest-Specific Protein 2 Domain [Rhizoctonia solani]